MFRSKLILLSITMMTTLVIFLLICILMPHHLVMGQQQQQQQSSPAQPTYPLDILFGKVENSVIQITSKISTNSPNPQIQNTTTLGSGFVYDKQGRIITNNHVVDDAKLVDVTFTDGSRYTAKTIGRDPYSDMAVLQIIGNLTQPLNPLIIGNSSKMQVGQQVIAIGHPFGFQNTMTTGIIGQTKYLLSIPELGVFMPNVIQTDAAINPGNSGGPLLNVKGEVIGLNIGRINSIGAPAPYPGLTVAAPSSALTRIIPILIEKGNYTHPYIGLTATTLTSDLAESIIGLPINFKGILINSIVKDGPADKAGIQGSTIDKYSITHWGDIITAIDGHPIVRIEDLIGYIEEHKSVGDKVMLSVYRNGQIIDLTTTLSSRPFAPQYLQKTSSSSSPPSPPPPL